MRRIALIDGPLPATHPALEDALDLSGGACVDSPAGRHANAMANAIVAKVPSARIVNIVVFPGMLTTDLATLKRALDAAAESAAEIVHCSLGLARQDDVLAAAVRRLFDRGRVVIAAAAARGGPVWPAAFPGVIAVQGDARCAPHQWSALDLSTADYGACPRLARDPGIAGASMAAAHLTGLLAGLRWRDEPTARAVLDAGATFRGRERRR